MTNSISTSEPKAANGTGSKFFYGWIIAAASMLIYAVAGAPVICFGIFVKPMAMDFGWGRGLIMGAIGLYIIAIALFSIIGGILVDRSGPKLASLAGALAMAAGMYFTSKIGSIKEFYLSFSLLTALGAALVTVPLQTTISRWFVARKGLALGIFFAGGGVGGLIASPMFQYWIDNGGWRTAFFKYSIIAAVVVICCSLFLKKEPSEMGLTALGAEDAQTSSEPEESMGKSDSTLGEAIKSSGFWLYGLANILLFMGILMVQVNFVPHATDHGIPAATAAMALGIASMVNAFGRLSMGAISDRIGTKTAYYICLALNALMVFWFIFIDQVWALYLFAIFFGFSYGGISPQGPKLITELYGVKSLGSILALVGIMCGIGPALGPVIGGVLFDRAGNYNLAFTVAAVSIALAIGIVFLIRKPDAPTSA